MVESSWLRLSMAAAVFFAMLSVIEFVFLLRSGKVLSSGVLQDQVDLSSVDAALSYPKAVAVPRQIPLMTRTKVVDKRGEEVNVTPFGSTVGVLNQVDYLQGHFLGWQQGLEVLATEGKQRLMAKSGEWHSGGGGNYEGFHPHFAEGFLDATRELQHRVRLLERATDRELKDCALRVIAPAETDPCADQDL